MTRDDCVLAELARLNSDVVPLAMRVIDSSATAQEQRAFAQRLIAAGERLHHRADECERVVIDGKAAFAEVRSLPADTGTNAVCHQRA